MQCNDKAKTPSYEKRHVECIHKSGECHQCDMQIDNNTNVKNHIKRNT